MNKGIKAAIKFFGSGKAYADAVGVSQPMISQINTGKAGVSPKLAIATEKATKGKVTRKMMRPDLFK